MLFDRPYIPPCGRNPYYDDPRDLKPTQETAMNSFASFVSSIWNLKYPSVGAATCGCDGPFEPIKPVSSESIEMIQCSKCGTYYTPRPGSSINVCDDCLREIGKEIAELPDPNS